MAISLREFNYDPALWQQDELDGISNSFRRSNWGTSKAICLDWKWGKILVVLKWRKSTELRFSKFYLVYLRKWTPTFKALIMLSLRPLVPSLYIKIFRIPRDSVPLPRAKMPGVVRDQVFQSYGNHFYKRQTWVLDLRRNTIFICY